MEQICALLLAEKSHDSKLLVVMKVFQDSYILSCYPLIIITYFYAKMQENFFLLYIFAILSFFTNVYYHFGNRSRGNLILFEICIL